MTTLSIVMPQIGQPDTTEDVKVQNAFTAIQTVINGQLDRSNLAAGIARLLLTSKSANYAAVDGDLVEMTAVSTTITLPTPTAGVTIGVSAASASTSAATPVTVTASAGTIASAGTLAASRTLGIPYVGVLLVADGSNWLTVSGQWDTGWKTLSASNATATGAPWYSPQIRAISDRAYLRGAASQTGAGTVTFTLPAGTIPASQASMPAMDFTANLMEALVALPGGTMTVLASAGHTIVLDGLSYSIV